VKVRLYIRVRLQDGNRPFVDPVFAAYGKLKPLYAIIDERPEHHSKGVYHLQHIKSVKRIWEKVGTDAASALTARLKRERMIEVKKAGFSVIEERPTPALGRDLYEITYTACAYFHISKWPGAAACFSGPVVSIRSSRK
jgi:hypothetical protein